MIAFKTLLPIFLLMPLGGVLQKLALDKTELSSGPLINLFFGSFIAVVTYVALCAVVPNVRRNLEINFVTVKVGIICSIFSTILIYTANLSYDLVANPAYATAVSFSSAIWVLLIYKIMGKQDNARILPGLGIVLFTALLVILSGRI